MQCNQCGQELIEGASFCVNCGAPVVLDQAAEVADAVVDEAVEAAEEAAEPVIEVVEIVEETVDAAGETVEVEVVEAVVEEAAPETPVAHVEPSPAVYAPAAAPIPNAAPAPAVAENLGFGTPVGYQAPTAQPVVNRTVNNYGRAPQYPNQPAGRVEQTAAVVAPVVGAYSYQTPNQGYAYPTGNQPNAQYAYGQQQYQYSQQTSAAAAGPDSNVKGNPDAKRVTAGLLGIFLGALGIHKFYLGFTTAAIITLCVTIIGACCTFGLSAVAMAVIGLIEGIMYLCKSDEEFYQTYVINKKQWF